MKKLILLTLLSVATQANALELKNYNQIEAVLKYGKVIHIAVDFTQCTPVNARQLVSSALAIYTPSAVQVANDNIAASLKHFTLDNPAYPNKPVYEFVRYTFTADNVLTLTNQTLDATNFAPLGDPMTLTCKLTAGVKVFI
jgi:hypothetical protein